MSLDDASALRELLEEGLRDQVAPALSAWVAVDGAMRAHSAAGEANPNTVFDLASLTKPMVVVTQVMEDVSRGLYRLDDLVELGGDQRRTYRDLLGHRSGLPAWEDLWAVATAECPGWTPGDPEVWRVVEGRIATLLERRGEPKTVYSDLGYIKLGLALERVHGRTLRELSARFGRTAGAAPTGPCPRRRAHLSGVVHDLNCWTLGGAAGHAGAFGTAAEVGHWALELLQACEGRGARLDGGVVREFWDRRQRSEGSTWVLGWDTPSTNGSSGGRFMSDQAVGHLGFTGTSVWLDPACGFIAVLLTNRVAGPEGSQDRIRTYRPRFHDALREHFRLT